MNCFPLHAMPRIGVDDRADLETLRLWAFCFLPASQFFPETRLRCGNVYAKRDKNRKRRTLTPEALPGVDPGLADAVMLMSGG